MAYEYGNNFVFGETPVASKWDQLWRNDDYLKDHVDAIEANSWVTTARIADLNVTTGKLASGAVTNAKLGTDAVQASNIAAGAVDTSELASGAVTTAKLSTSAGDPGAAGVSFTPSFTNFTLGNGSINYARYLKVGRIVVVDIRVILGSSSSMGTDPAINFPVTPRSLVAFAPIGDADLFNSGDNHYMGRCIYNNSTNFIIRALGVSGADIVTQVINSTTPFSSWGANDEINCHLVYEANSL